MSDLVTVTLVVSYCPAAGAEAPHQSFTAVDPTLASKSLLVELALPKRLL